MYENAARNQDGSDKEVASTDDQTTVWEDGILIADGGRDLAAVWADLTGFQRDALVALGALEREGQRQYGLGIANELEADGYETVNHGRLYPGLNTLEEHGLIEKSKLNERTNEYALTEDGWALLEARAERFESVTGRERVVADGGLDQPEAWCDFCQKEFEDGPDWKVEAPSFTAFFCSRSCAVGWGATDDGIERVTNRNTADVGELVCDICERDDFEDLPELADHDCDDRDGDEGAPTLVADGGHPRCDDCDKSLVFDETEHDKCPTCRKRSGDLDVRGTSDDTHARRIAEQLAMKGGEDDA